MTSTSLVDEQLRWKIYNEFVDIESIPLQKAKEEYFDFHKRKDNKLSTIDTYENRVDNFIDICHDNDIYYTNEITKEVIQTYLEEEFDEKAISTENKAVNTVHHFFRVLALDDYLDGELLFPLRTHNVDGEPEREILRYEEYKEIIEYLRKFERATREHIVWEIFAGTGCRIGALEGLNKNDIELNEKNQELRIHFNNTEDFSLKNGQDSNRVVSYNINDFYSEAYQYFKEYIENHRKTVNEDSEPLLTTKSRLSESTIRKYIYKWSCPCMTGNECPIGKNPENCEYIKNKNNASKCPESKCPRSIRRGHVTYLAENGIGLKDIGDRVDAEPYTLDKHYDISDKNKKCDTRSANIRDKIDN